MEGAPGTAGQGPNTQESFDDRVQPAIPGLELNIPAVGTSQQPAGPSQVERLGTLSQPAANERGTAPK